MGEGCLKQAVGAKALKGAAPLFDGWDETMILSALQGIMGMVWTCGQKDDPPRAAVCENGDFVFFAGDAASAEARVIAEAFRQRLGGRGAILTPQTPAWLELLKSVFGDTARPGERYAIRKEGDCFDRERLRGFVHALPDGLRLRPIDRRLYDCVMEAEWSRDFCSQFGSAERYLAHGLGVVALRGDELVGGASSYIYYKEGIEIEVDTRADMRRRGIALACCAQLILNALDRGLYPSWDAASRASVALAEKLGYREAGPYAILEINE